MQQFPVVKTRFPPSPTGDLHIGGARVALFNYLFAKHHGGTCVLRMEDTDKERSSDAFVQSIIQGLDWLGLHCDEGPYYQTQRFDRYHEVIQQLLDAGHAYRCYCTKARLDLLRQEQQANKEKPRYDGCCREAPDRQNNDPFVVRFKTPQEGEVVFEDAVLGSIAINNNQLDDLIIARSDSSPTYHLTVVVDDWDMQISHVIRGVDHINNTPRQIHLLRAMGAPMPQYAHLPMVLGADGKRLSKRHGAVSVLQYRDEGYLPQAMLNQLVRLSWSCGDQEIFSLDEMVQSFSLEAVNRSDAVFDVDKLAWLNQHYLKTLPAEAVIPSLRAQFERLGLDVSTGPALDRLLAAVADRYKTTQDIAQQCQYFYQPRVSYAEKAKKHLSPDAMPILEALHEVLSALPSWEQVTIHAAMKNVIEAQALSFGQLAQPVRVAVTGDTRSPSMDLTLSLLGRSVTLERIRLAMDYINA